MRTTARYMIINQPAMRKGLEASVIDEEPVTAALLTGKQINFHESISPMESR